MKSARRVARELPWITLAVGLAAWLVHLLPSAAGLLEYDRASLARGEWWRLLTGHLVHWSDEHLLWDLLVFLILGAACESYGRRRLLAALAGSALLIPALAWFLLPSMQVYRGLSGLDSTLFVMLALLLAAVHVGEGRLRAFIVPATALAAFAAKVVFEVTVGNAVFVDSAGLFVPVPLAHAAGAVVGALTGLAPPPSRTPASSSERCSGAGRLSGRPRRKPRTAGAGSMYQTFYLES